jgi:hypothetical protein
VRLAGFSLLLILPLALLVGLLPRSGANSQPIAQNVFADRWPSEDALFRSLPSMPRADVGPEREPGIELIAQRQPLVDASARFQTTSSRQTAPRLQPQPRPSPAAPLAQSKTELIKFATAPFPYDGMVPTTEQPFLNVLNGKRKGHRTARGSVLWQDATFNDSRVLVHLPSGFDINRPAVMVVYFHGHGAELTRDVLERQNVPEQITQSGVNAVLVAPQFAVDAADSSAGRFWQPGGFGRFVNEASKKLAKLYGTPANAKKFSKMPVIIVAYSGGYLPAAWSIRNGDLGRRLRGLVLLDALYGEIGNFASWIKNSKSVFFVSAYTSSTRRQNLELARILDEKNVRYSADIGGQLWRGRNVSLLSTGADVNHQDFVTNAWTSNPIADILAKLN